MSEPSGAGRHLRRRKRAPTRMDFTYWGGFVAILFILIIVFAVFVFGG